MDVLSLVSSKAIGIQLKMLRYTVLLQTAGTEILVGISLHFKYNKRVNSAHCWVSHRALGVREQTRLDGGWTPAQRAPQGEGNHPEQKAKETISY